jgi:thymidine kinase
MGPMFAGKTERLIGIVNTLDDMGKNVIYIGPKQYERDKINGYSTHSSAKIHNKSVIMNTDMLMDIYDKIPTNTHTICIDEAQFFTDIYEFCRSLLNSRPVHINVAGLIGDSDQNMFGSIYKLLPIADDVRFTTAICRSCDKASAPFTRSTENREKGQIKIGNDYSPVCRKCLAFV